MGQHHATPDDEPFPDPDHQYVGQPGVANGGRHRLRGGLPLRLGGPGFQLERQYGVSLDSLITRHIAAGKPEWLPVPIQVQIGLCGQMREWALLNTNDR